MFGPTFSKDPRRGSDHYKCCWQALLKQCSQTAVSSYWMLLTRKAITTGHCSVRVPNSIWIAMTSFFPSSVQQQLLNNWHFKGLVYLYLFCLKPTGYVMHQQFNIQQLYVLPTLYLPFVRMQDVPTRVWTTSAVHRHTSLIISCIDSFVITSIVIFVISVMFLA